MGSRGQQVLVQAILGVAEGTERAQMTPYEFCYDIVLGVLKVQLGAPNSLITLQNNKLWELNFSNTRAYEQF